MDSHISGEQDELSGLERRLSGWRPSDRDLHTDAMLFEAGKAAGRSRKRPFLGLTVGVFLAALALGSGLWGLHERSQRQALVAELRELNLANANVQPKTIAGGSESIDGPLSDDYLSLRRRVERDPDRWLALMPPVSTRPSGPPPEEPAIFRAGQRDGLLSP
jgi:hypothetical protein